MMFWSSSCFLDCDLDFLEFLLLLELCKWTQRLPTIVLMRQRTSHVPPTNSSQLLLLLHNVCRIEFACCVQSFLFFFSVMDENSVSGVFRLWSKLFTTPSNRILRKLFESLQCWVCLSEEKKKTTKSLVVVYLDNYTRVHILK